MKIKRFIFVILFLGVAYGVYLWNEEVKRFRSLVRENIRKSPNYEAAKEDYKRDPNKNSDLDYYYEDKK